MTKSERETQKAEAIKQLREYLPAGSTIYTILRDTSRSGMSRRISVVTMAHSFTEWDQQCEEARDGVITGKDLKECYPLHLTNLVARALGWRIKKGFNDSLIVSGCGMDMGFHVVYSLSQALGYNVNGGKPVENTNCYGLNHAWL